MFSTKARSTTVSTVAESRSIIELAASTLIVSWRLPIVSVKSSVALPATFRITSSRVAV